MFNSFLKVRGKVMVICVLIIIGIFITSCSRVAVDVTQIQNENTDLRKQIEDLTLINIEQTRQVNELTSRLDSLLRTLESTNSTPQSPATTPIHTPAPTQPSTSPPNPVLTRYYLESDLMSTTSSDGRNAKWYKHPENGTFTIDGVTYHRGASTDDVGYAIATATASATFDLTEHDITRLSGTFGFARRGNDGRGWNNQNVINATRGSLTVIDADSGRFLGGGDVTLRNHVTQINVDIPQGVNRVSISMEVTGGYVLVAFGDAFFE
jgi:type II secretory pathway pseudopilin PulG